MHGDRPGGSVGTPDRVRHRIRDRRGGGEHLPAGEGLPPAGEDGQVTAPAEGVVDGGGDTVAAGERGRPPRALRRRHRRGHRAEGDVRDARLPPPRRAVAPGGGGDRAGDRRDDAPQRGGEGPRPVRVELRPGEQQVEAHLCGVVAGPAVVVAGGDGGGGFGDHDGERELRGDRRRVDRARVPPRHVGHGDVADPVVDEHAEGHPAVGQFLQGDRRPEGDVGDLGPHGVDNPPHRRTRREHPPTRVTDGDRQGVAQVPDDVEEPRVVTARDGHPDHRLRPGPVEEQEHRRADHRRRVTAGEAGGRDGRGEVHVPARAGRAARTGTRTGRGVAGGPCGPVGTGRPGERQGCLRRGEGVAASRPERAVLRRPRAEGLPDRRVRRPLRPAGGGAVSGVSGVAVVAPVRAERGGEVGEERTEAPLVRPRVVEQQRDDRRRVPPGDDGGADRPVGGGERRGQQVAQDDRRERARRRQRRDGRRGHVGGGEERGDDPPAVETRAGAQHRVPAAHLLQRAAECLRCGRGVALHDDGEGVQARGVVERLGGDDAPLARGTPSRAGGVRVVGGRRRDAAGRPGSRGGVTGRRGARAPGCDEVVAGPGEVGEGPVREDLPGGDGDPEVRAEPQGQPVGEK
ncbi:hypothetical protein MTQ22_06645 [Corynebacterium bovis]